jgi:Reverse transcriptase (RNA-dependent DNA polymerase)
MGFWMKKMLWGGRANILVNGELIDFCECRQRGGGFRQGDHLFPYLFILTADGLNKMIQRGTRTSHLEGLGLSFTSHGKILHLQYADDTLIFLKANATMVENLKWFFFIAFEGISRLKVNFDKSELIPLNIFVVQAQYFSNILGCKLGSLPIKYLDFFTLESSLSDNLDVFGK